MSKTLFTTGEAAKICKVAPRTISKWFSAGLLKGYRLPGSNDRRIPRENLKQFLQEHGMPLGELEHGRCVLVVGTDSQTWVALNEHLAGVEGLRREYAASGFEAGVLTEAVMADTVVIDLAMGRSEAILIAQKLRLKDRYAVADLIALVCEDGVGPERLMERGFNAVFQKPFDAALLAERIVRGATPRTPTTMAAP